MILMKARLQKNKRSFQKSLENDKRRTKKDYIKKQLCRRLKHNDQKKKTSKEKF